MIQKNTRPTFILQVQLILSRSCHVNWMSEISEIPLQEDPYDSCSSLHQFSYEFYGIHESHDGSMVGAGIFFWCAIDPINIAPLMLVYIYPYMDPSWVRCLPGYFARERPAAGWLRGG